MGHFTYRCKHCGHDILDSQSTWKGLNEWMSSAVVLTEDGSRIKGEYDGYGRVGSFDGDDLVDGDNVWVHEACWREAGKPDYEDYDGPSAGSQHSGYNEGDLLPEPGTEVNQAAWEAALADRAKAIRATHVRNVMQAVKSGHELFTCYYFSGEYQLPGENKPAGWVVYSNLHAPDATEVDDSVDGIETEEEAKALVAQKTAEFLASDEFVAIKAEHEAGMVERAQAHEARLREAGEDRYVVTKYGPVEGWSVYDNCDPRAHDETMSVGEDGDEAATYLLLGGTEEAAKALAAEKNAEWRAS